MSKPSPYHSYSAADIRRYLEGSMNHEEMHALEKASLDDPFLADAIEGFKSAPADQTLENIESLRRRLHQRLEKERPQVFSWWRMAAIFILVLGASLAAWYLVKPAAPENAIAKVEELRPVTGKKDTVSAPAIQVPRISPDAETTAMAKRNGGELASSINKVQPVKKSPVPGLTPAADEISPVKAPDSLKAAPVAGTTARAENAEGDLNREKPAAAQAGPPKAKSMAAPEQGRDKSVSDVPTRYFRGRITDAKDKPIPYASIRVSESSKGTYTDLNGNFSIVASDSVLHVDIASVGFQPVKIDMAAGKTSTIRLHPAGQNLNEVVVTGYARKAKADSVTNRSGGSIYAEPRDGWSLYEIYLANNLRHPAIQGNGTLKGSVTLSFYVDPHSADLYDFKVEKSLHTSYDKEAIRVVREGPAWDVFNTDSRVRVTYTVVF